MSLLPLLGAPLLAVLGTLVAAHRGRLHAALTLAASVFCLGWSIALAATGAAPVDMGGWPPPRGIRLAADPLSRLFLLVNTFVFTAAALELVGRSLEAGAEAPGMVHHLTFPILLFALNGLFLTTDFFNFYVLFELMSIGAFLLVTQGTRQPLEAAWKFAVQSIVGSICLLAAIAFVYGVSGSLAMEDVAARLEQRDAVTWIAPLFLFAFVLKASVFPFHWWQADAHAAATTPGSVILAGTIINVGIYGIVRFWPLLFGGSLRWLILGIGAASIFFGALAAFRTDDAKRLLGFSSTSQLGFVLLALGWSASSAAALFFLAAHAVAKALLFLATGVVGDHAGSYSLRAVSGAGVRRRLAAYAYLLGFVSLVGLPPTAGFVGKIGVMGEGIRAGDWIGVGLVIAGSLATLGYAARGYQALFWGRAEATGSEATGPTVAEGFIRAALALSAAGVVGGALLGGPLWALCANAARAAGRVP